MTPLSTLSPGQLADLRRDYAAAFEGKHLFIHRGAFDRDDNPCGWLRARCWAAARLAEVASVQDSRKAKSKSKSKTEAA